MANNYTINWSNNNVKPPFQLKAGTLDFSTTSLALSGRGLINWGEPLQENLLKILENFASPISPLNPTLGQIWFNTVTNEANIYFDNLWNKLSSVDLINGIIVTQNNRLINLQNSLTGVITQTNSQTVTLNALKDDINSHINALFSAGTHGGIPSLPGSGPEPVPVFDSMSLSKSEFNNSSPTATLTLTFSGYNANSTSTVNIVINSSGNGEIQGGSGAQSYTAISNNSGIVVLNLAYNAITSTTTGQRTIQITAYSQSRSVNYNYNYFAPGGSFVMQYCVGTTLIGRYADGQGGTYDSTIETNSPSCGYTPPAPAPNPPPVSNPSITTYEIPPQDGGNYGYVGTAAGFFAGETVNWIPELEDGTTSTPFAGTADSSGNLSFSGQIRIRNPVNIRVRIYYNGGASSIVTQYEFSSGYERPGGT